MKSVHRHVYGPVPSRRLGFSLGVDLVPHKTCSYDCIYCQLGHTQRTTCERAAYVPAATVLFEVSQVLESGGHIDYVTLSGAGEPTLHADIGGILAGIRAMTRIPVALLTNGSLLWDEDLQNALLPLDLVAPSLDAGTPDTFARVNHAHPAISFRLMVDGLARFRERFSGQYWLEVMLLDGINDGDAEVEAMAAIIERIRPDRVQLNTVVRPPADEAARAVPAERMAAIARRFDPAGEVVPEFQYQQGGSCHAACSDAALGLLERRPCTVFDVAQSLGISVISAMKELDVLVQSGCITAGRGQHGVYYAKAPECPEGGNSHG